MNDWLEFSSQTSWLPPLFGINRVVKERVYPLDLKWSYTIQHYLPFDGPATTDH